MAVSADFCRVMVDAGTTADSLWREHGSYIAGEKGYLAMHYVSVRIAHPSFPIFMNILGCLPMCANGLKINLWGSSDPFAMAVVNVNHSQTRKSRLTAMSESLASTCDTKISSTLALIWEHKEKALNHILAAKKKESQEADSDPATDKTTPFPGLWSVGFCGGTIERVKERCAGDYSTVVQNPKAWE